MISGSGTVDGASKWIRDDLHGFLQDQVRFDFNTKGYATWKGEVVHADFRFPTSLPISANINHSKNH